MTLHTIASSKRRRQRPALMMPSITHPFLLFLGLFLLVATTTNAQFNEPPGQRREQTFRVREFELSNINQHYPGDLRYYCTFRGKWSRERHPNDFPNASSWSSPTIISHSKDWRMWTGTETVTAGVEYMAEVSFEIIKRTMITQERHLSLPKRTILLHIDSTSHQDSNHFHFLISFWYRRDFLPFCTTSFRMPDSKRSR